MNFDNIYLKIIVQDYSWTCGDGCCSESKNLVHLYLCDPTDQHSIDFVSVFNYYGKTPVNLEHILEMPELKDEYNKKAYDALWDAKLTGQYMLIHYEGENISEM